jgi:hypothetical protein
MPNGPKPEHIREKAIAALLSCSTIKLAAHKAGVARRTLEQWLHHDPEFQQQLAEARRKALELAVGRLAKGTAAAVTTLVKACRKGDVKAATAVVDRAIRGIELADVLQRLEVLEQAKKRRDGAKR